MSIVAVVAYLFGFVSGAAAPSRELAESDAYVERYKDLLAAQGSKIFQLTAELEKHKLSTTVARRPLLNKQGLFGKSPDSSAVEVRDKSFAIASHGASAIANLAPTRTVDP